MLLFCIHCFFFFKILGRSFCNEETFGQYPLQVNSFSNIHESLEAAMTQEIESSDIMTKSGQEVICKFFLYHIFAKFFLILSFLILRSIHISFLVLFHTNVKKFNRTGLKNLIISP